MRWDGQPARDGREAGARRCKRRKLSLRPCRLKTRLWALHPMRRVAATSSSGKRITLIVPDVDTTQTSWLWGRAAISLGPDATGIDVAIRRFPRSTAATELLWLLATKA